MMHILKIVGSVVLILMLCSGCVMYVVYKPSQPVQLYAHNQTQNGTNVINETVPITAKVADALVSAIGIQANGNSAQMNGNGSDNVGIALGKATVTSNTVRVSTNGVGQ